jgi:5-methylcytosine-specific restriction protein B
MSFPNNIKKEHILKAIERIDSGDIPPNSSSKFYDLEYNSKLYPPKLVFSFANSFVNNVDLDRDSFRGGPEKPAFKLLEREGFKIIEKVKIPKIKLYDFHGESALKNADRLLSSNQEWFYWDDGNFKKYINGDIVFWVNRNTRKALFTKVDEVEIKPVYENGRNYIRENGIEVYAYAQNENSYENFFRFKVLQIVDIPIEWNYLDPKVFQNQLMSFILFENNISDIDKRISKIDDLLLLFTSGDANYILNNAKELLNDENASIPSKLIPEILEAIDNPLIKSELSHFEFKFTLAQKAFENFKNYENTTPDFYEIQKDRFKGVGFSDFLNSLDKVSDEYKLFMLIAELYSYCDLRAPNKEVFNNYDDKRSLADSGVRQYAWVINLLNYKINGNSIENLTPSIKHALEYLIDPNDASTMLSVRHRTLFCQVFLNGKAYSESTFISDYLNFFEPYEIKQKVVNSSNYIHVLDLILYGVSSVRKLWLGSQKEANKSKTSSSNLDIFQSFEEDTKSIGLIFKHNLILRYIASLWTKPFVILTGLSGSGKTKLAQSFAKWLCTDINQFSIIPVGADWTNREPLLGYPNSLVEGHYVSPESGALDLILSAIDNYNGYKKIENDIVDISNCKPYFLILDEMNLSHVERYFSDFLSAMESGDEIRLYNGESRIDSKGNPISANFSLPPNLFIIGTVNIDETTYMFSPKVLDRANTIEFRIEEDDLETFFKSGKTVNLESLEEKREETFESEFMLMLAKKNNQLPQDLQTIFKSYFNVLKIAGVEFGYRTLNEVSILINFIREVVDQKKDKENKILNNAIDIAIMQKLLPKLNGSRSKMIKVLPQLCGLCYDLAEGEPKLILDASLRNDFNKPSSIKFELSFDKICKMYKSAIENGFTSFAEA